MAIQGERTGIRDVATFGLGRKTFILSKTVLTGIVWGVLCQFWLDPPWQRALCCLFAILVVGFRIAAVKGLTVRSRR